MVGLPNPPSRTPDAAEPAACPDDRLLARYEAGRSAEAFAQLVARHGPMVYRTCRRLLSDAHDAEDATQATFLLLARHPGRARRSPAGWLYTVARDTSLKLLRDRARRRRREEVAAQMKTPAPEPDARLREEIDAALAGLPRHLQEAVVLCHLEGRNQEEAAALLGCHQGTLSRRVREGLDRLRTLLLGRGVAVSAATLTAFLATEAAATAAAPVAVLTAATATATAGAAAVGGNAALLADGVAKAVVWAKAKMIAAVTAAAAVPVAVTVPLVLPDKPAEAPAVETRFWDPAVAFSPDGKTVAAAAPGGVVKLWDVATGTERAAFPGHPAGVYAVAFAPDGRTVASGDGRGNVFVRDAATGGRRAEFTSRPPADKFQAGLSVWPSGVLSLAFLPDGRLAVGTVDNAIRVRDLGTGDERELVPSGPNNLSNRVVVSRDGLAVASTINGALAARVWDVTTGQPKATLGGAHERVWEVAVLADGKSVATGGHQYPTADRKDPAAVVRVYDLGTGKERPPVRGPRNAAVHALAASPAGPVLAWAEAPLNRPEDPAAEVTVKLYDANQRKDLAAVRMPSDFVRLAFSPDGKTLAVGCRDGTVRFKPVPRTP